MRYHQMMYVKCLQKILYIFLLILDRLLLTSMTSGLLVQV